ncbi:hypothetical protein TWF694_003202 [Orbilia ellipsospora]|uniref:Amino acid transporter n=1 Tax=Orbilia ellipsospora TaxID=2528407 RepID=A0AAV9X3A9_9PEZI
MSAHDDDEQSDVVVPLLQNILHGEGEVENTILTTSDAVVISNVGQDWRHSPQLALLSPTGSGDDTDPSTPSRTIPETATFGRNLGWFHVYSLVVSRTIGSGIFATPGSIYRSVGSVGLSLILWVVGAVIAACALTVSLEFGCMLPRSGGEKVRV